MTGIKRGSDNVYKDLHFSDAGEMQIKAQLVTRINDIIKGRKWTQRQAAEILGIWQSGLSRMLQGQFHVISQSKLLEYLATLERDETIIASPARRSRQSAAQPRP